MRQAHFFQGLILWVGLTACSGSIVSSGGNGGGAPDADTGPDVDTDVSADAGAGGSGGQASVLGKSFEGDCRGPAAKAFSDQCTAEGGFWEYCNNVACSYVPGPGTVCSPPSPAPANDEFACAHLNCKVGQVCRYDQPLGDGCAMHSCKTPPAPCDTTPTCACLEAAAMTDPGSFGGTCTEDAAGNATLSSFGQTAWGWTP